MTRRLQRSWRIGWACLALTGLLAGGAQAALINLQAYVTYALLNNDGTTPLADGSIVQIIGSFDGTIDPIGMQGTNVTGQTTGDDVILATITIQSSELGSNGTFFAGDIYFESDEIQYMYIRFYDSTGPLTGLVYWGESVISNATHHQFGVLEMDFVGNYVATNPGNFNFTAIPEPGTLNFILMWSGMVAAMRASMKREKKKGQSAPKVRPLPCARVDVYERF